MSIFGSIMSKIFGTDAKAAGAPGAAAGTGGSAGGAAGAAGASAGAGAGSGAAGGAVGQVDVEATLTDLAKKSGRPSNWRVSIVDLMTLLGLDSSLAHRKELAKELGYTGDTNDSATMNIWLHKQVMRKLAENGGKVPDDLKNA
ncbi:DUF3597 domain-containing protein [Enterovirga sp.]|uniref:DUF3597 domain-containing protein n=1 Tax=Enterovirga sp. TaxID=2026350 RepID=UPI002636E65F|nr:DUF3597 domain-containing protein [Enterovirga sp.]MDB5592643.1 hypothetical protein [Enterovirga sp.]